MFSVIFYHKPNCKFLFEACLRPIVLVSMGETEDY